MSDTRGGEPPEQPADAADAHYRRMFEAVPVGIYALDAEDRFSEINPAGARIMGIAADRLIGSDLSAVLPPEERDQVAEMTARLRTGETPMLEMDIHAVRPDGERRLVHVTASPIVEHGAVAGTHGVLTDVTEERAREGVMHRAERLAAIGTLLSGVAHELNNPLNAIRNFAQLMLLDERSEDDREALEIMRDEADRAARIVADLRGIARGTKGSEALVPVDVNELVRQALKLRQYAPGAGAVPISLRLADDLPRVLANPAELEQALLNLVVNAEEALPEAPEGGSIEISTHRLDDGVELQVEDTGRGVPADHMGRIFDPFWTTKAPGEGAGLGLSLVHRIVSDHGGDVQVRSEPGAGAVFTIQLPSAAAGPEPPDEDPLPDPARPLRVLVVDDERALRGSISRYLRRRGHTVEEAADGGSALEMIGRQPPYDVILTDLKMPRIGGEALLERLRSAGEGLDRRVVVITGHAGESDRARIAAATGAPILSKPADLEAIAAAVERQAERALNR